MIVVVDINNIQSAMNRYYQSFVARRRIADFYERQEKLLREYEADKTLISLEVEQFRIGDDAQVNRRRHIDRRLSSITLCCNVMLLVAKIVAAYLAHSLSVTSTALDSAMDISSGLIVW